MSKQESAADGHIYFRGRLPVVDKASKLMGHFLRDSLIKDEEQGMSRGLHPQGNYFFASFANNDKEAGTYCNLVLRRFYLMVEYCKHQYAWKIRGIGDALWHNPDPAFKKEIMGIIESAIGEEDYCQFLAEMKWERVL